MKLNKIKNYILTFIVCLLGAFTFNSIETKAIQYDNDTNNYVSSNILNTDNFIKGTIEANGDYKSSNYRVISDPIIIDYNNPMSFVLYAKIYNMGLCNNFRGARFGIHTYNSTETFNSGTHINDSGWISLSNGTSIDYELPSNTKAIRFVFSFSSTSNVVDSNTTEIKSIELSQVRCMQIFVGHTMNSNDPFEPYGKIYSFGQLFNYCSAEYETNSFYNCMPFVENTYLGPKYEFNEVKNQLQYNNLNPIGYYYNLRTYQRINVQNMGLYINTFEINNPNVSIEFFYNGTSTGGFNISDAKYIDLSTLDSPYIDQIKIYNYSVSNSIESFQFIDYGQIKQVAQENYSNGFQAGSASGNTLVGMIGAIMSGPVNMLITIFNFEFLGINLATFILSLVTLLVVVWLIKKFI